MALDVTRSRYSLDGVVRQSRIYSAAKYSPGCLDMLWSVSGLPLLVARNSSHAVDRRGHCGDRKLYCYLAQAGSWHCFWSNGWGLAGVFWAEETPPRVNDFYGC